MSNKELSLIMRLKDEVTKNLTVVQGRMSKFSNEVRKNWLLATAAIAAAIIAIKKASEFVLGILHETIRVSSQFERWEVQLRSFTKNAEEAKKVIKELIQFSVKTPFTPEEVIEAGKLLKPLEDLGFQLTDLLTAAGNASAAFGLTMQESSLQLVRAFTSGIGAADLFRDRGVRSFIEIRKGIDLTQLSMNELRKVLLETLTGGDLGQAIKREALTFQGLISTLQGEFLLFKQQVGEKIFEQAKIDLRNVLGLISKSKEEGDKYRQVVDKISQSFLEAFNTAKNFLITTLVMTAQLVDAFNELKSAGLSVQFVWLKFIELLMRTQGILAKLDFANRFANDDSIKAGLEVLQSDLITLEGKILEARTQADREFSESIRLQIKSLQEALETQKQITVEEFKNLKNSMNTTNEEFVSQSINIFKKMSDRITEELSKFKKTEQVIFDSLKKSVDSFSTIVGDGFADMILEGKNFAKSLEDAFKSMARTFIAEVAKMIAKWLAFMALKKIGSFFGGGFFHDGGVVHSVPRAHSGLAVDEVPIIAQTGEGILSRQAMRNIGGPKVLNQLNSGRQGGFGGFNINGDIIVNVPTQRSDMSPEEIGLLIGDQIEKRIREGRSFI